MVSAAVETMQLSHAWQSKEGHPEPTRERHTSAQAWDGGGKSGSQVCGLRQDLSTILLFSFFSLCSFWGIASQLTPAHNLTFHSPCLWQGLLAFAMPSASTAHPLLSLESRAIPYLLLELLSSAL